jgi:zinc transport system ATP-binding protein
MPAESRPARALEPAHGPLRAPGTLIAAEGLEVRFGATRVLTQVALTVNEGEVVTLIGPNGAGKSTLVRAVLGLIAPSAGQVWRRPGLRIGYVPQRMVIDPVLPLTVGRFLSLARAGATPKAGSATQIGAALERVAAAALIEESIHDLSGGEFQRVLLARALMRDPELLVLDEPVQGVDFAGQVALYDLIGRLRARLGLGVLMVSHDLHVVMAATDRVVCLNHHVCCSGAPEAVSRNPEYTALFGAAAARGLAIYSHHHDHEHDLKGEVVRAGEDDSHDLKYHDPGDHDRQDHDPRDHDPGDHEGEPRP